MDKDKKFEAFLGIPVLATWFLSLLLWLYIAVTIVRYDMITHWLLGLIVFVVSFTFLVMFLTLWWDGGLRSLASRFARALLLTTSFYSLLLFGYLAPRVVIDQAPLGSPFIDTLLPWFTFVRLGCFAFVLSLLSLLAYIVFFGRSDSGLVARHSG